MQLAILPRATYVEPPEQQAAPPPLAPPQPQRPEDAEEQPRDERRDDSTPPPEEQQLQAPAEFAVAAQDVALDPTGALRLLGLSPGCRGLPWLLGSAVVGRPVPLAALHAPLPPTPGEPSSQPRPTLPSPWPPRSLPSTVLYFAAQQKRAGGRGGRSRNVVFSQDRGRYVKPMFPKGKVRRLAVDATLRAAAPHQRSRRRRAELAGKAARRVYIEQDDLR